MIIPTLLDILERSLLYINTLTNIIINLHYNATYSIIKKYIPGLTPRKILIVGGGILPRSIIILKKLYPSTELHVLDMSKQSLREAQNYLKTYTNEDNVFYIHSEYDPSLSKNYDLVVFPLAFRGLYSTSYTTTLRHCWIWERHARAEVVSMFLLKKIVIEM